MKSYFDIAGDGGSGIVAQVARQRARVDTALSRIRHRIAVASGKGGVGKSTLTLQIACALRARGLSVAIMDADLNGPSQAHLAGLRNTAIVPEADGRISLPRTTNGIGVFSLGFLLPESDALDFASAASGDSHTWRATREFTLMGELLASIDWGPLDVLLFDLPPGPERTLQYAEFLGSRTAFVLVTMPSDLSRGVVARSATALLRNRTTVLGCIENMSGYYCRDCGAVKPLFATGRDGSVGVPSLGEVPFDPEVARSADRGLVIPEVEEGPVARVIGAIAARLIELL
jgi:ATP-binding protein involved in chromosome partitioning